MFMDSWINTRQIIDDDQRRNQEIWLQKERVARVKRPILWRQLVATVSEHLKTYQQRFPSKPRIQMRMPKSVETTFAIQKLGSPSVKVHATFQDCLIELSFEYRDGDLGRVRCWAEQLEFSVGEGEQVHFAHDGVPLFGTDDAAEIILKPFLEPWFEPPDYARPIPGRARF